MARHAVQTPGETPKAPETTENPAEGAGELQAVAVQKGDEPSEVDRMRAMIDAQAAQIANLMGAVQNLARSGAGNGSKPSQDASSELPELSDVNVHSLKAPLLTKQGWVVPPEYGTPPEHLRGR